MAAPRERRPASGFLVGSRMNVNNVPFAAVLAIAVNSLVINGALAMTVRLARASMAGRTIKPISAE